MKNLIIDCSCGMNIYLKADDKIYEKVDGNQNKHTDELLLAVDALLSDAKIKISDVDNFCVCVGPGSFTGVRVAISIIKGLVIGSNAKVFVLTNFDIFDIEEKIYYLVFDGFSNFVYVRDVKNGVNYDACLDVDDFVRLYLNEKKEVYVSTEKAQNLLKNYKINAKIAQNCIISKFDNEVERKNEIEVNQIFPVYLRASQAEIERNKKK